MLRYMTAAICNQSFRSRTAGGTASLWSAHPSISEASTRWHRLFPRTSSATVEAIIQQEKIAKEPGAFVVL